MAVKPFRLVYLLPLLLSLSLMASVTAGGGDPCTTPPTLTIPNGCHLYTWRNFPEIETHYAENGLFNNDTSYDFQFNSTDIIAYDLCVNAVPGTDNVDNALLPQILIGGTQWQDLHGSMLTLGSGSVSLDFGPACTGYQTVNSTLLSLTGEQTFRIAGQQNQAVGGGCCGNPQFSQVFLQMFFGNTVTPITTTAATVCNPGAVAVNGMTVRCTAGSGTVTAATLVTFTYNTTIISGHTQSGTSSCTIAINANSCTKAVAFSPVFASTPVVIMDWSPQTTNVKLAVPSIPETSTVIPILN